MSSPDPVYSEAPMLHYNIVVARIEVFKVFYRTGKSSMLTAGDQTVRVYLHERIQVVARTEVLEVLRTEREHFPCRLQATAPRIPMYNNSGATM